MQERVEQKVEIAEFVIAGGAAAIKDQGGAEKRKR
jgi:hypothetical protein